MPQIFLSEMPRFSLFGDWKRKVPPPHPFSAAGSGLLVANNVPGLCGIDTRALVKKLRDDGEMKGQIIIEGVSNTISDVVTNPVKEVSTKEPRAFRYCVSGN